MLARLNMLLLLILLPGLLLAAGLTFRVELGQVERDLEREAGLLLDVQAAVRDYTAVEVATPLQVAAGIRGDFHPQEVPFYAARAVASRLTDAERRGGAEVRSVALAAMNPAATARSWEVDLVQRFARTGEAELSGLREVDGEDVVFRARPVVATPACLRCHDRKQTAPPALLAQYPAAAGFGWKAGEVVGADVVTLPVRHGRAEVERSLAVLTLSMVGVFSLMFVVLNIIVSREIFLPVRSTVDRVEALSLGGRRGEPLDERAPSELGRLNRSVNRLARSLDRALELAAERDEQDEPE